MKTMDEVLRGFVKDGEAAGVSALVFKDGREAYFGAYGEKDLQTHAPFERDTLVHIYSMSKIVTAVTALAYMERGFFRLDDPVAKYMEEFAHAKLAAADSMGGIHLIPAKTPITFRHLFTMRSGIPYPGSEDNAAMRAVSDAYKDRVDGEVERRWARGERVSTAEYVRLIASCPLCFEPGTHWMYGLSIDVLGGLIEAMTGMTLYQAMREAVLDKLKMEDTCFALPKEKEVRLSTIYQRDEKGDMVPYLPERWEDIQSGGGGLISSIDDMMRLARMLLGGGALNGVRVLREETVREMTRVQFDLNRVPGYDWDCEAGYGYGLGVRVMCDPEKSDYDESAGAFGWNGMAGTSLRVSPKDGQAAVFFVQHVPPRHEVFLPPFARAARAL